MKREKMTSRNLRLLLVLICLAVLAAACGPLEGGETPEPLPTPTAEPAASPTPPAVSTPTQPPSPTAEVVAETATAPPSATAEGPGEALTTPVERTADLSKLPITFPIMSEEIAAYFNQIARPDDIALFQPRYLNLLPLITQGKTKTGFASWAEAEVELDGLLNQIDMISYNPEHWDQTPESEKADLPGTVQRAAQVAHEKGLPLLVAPDRRFARDHIAEIAPYADIIVLQGQRMQQDPQEFADFMHEMISQARASNPQIKIIVQIGPVQGSTPQDMLTAIQTVAGEIDGISIWSNPRSFPALKEFISMIRPEG